MPATTRRSSMRSAWTTIEARRDLDRGRRHGIRRQASTGGNRPRRPIRRHRLRHRLRVHHRPDGCTAVPRSRRARRWQPPARALQPHGRQAHDSSPRPARRTRRTTERRGDGSSRQSDPCLPGARRMILQSGPAGVEPLPGCPECGFTSVRVSGQTTVAYLFPEPSPRTLRWVAVHTAHELLHHLYDIDDDGAARRPSASPPAGRDPQQPLRSERRRCFLLRTRPKPSGAWCSAGVDPVRWTPHRAVEGAAAPLGERASVSGRL